MILLHKHMVNIDTILDNNLVYVKHVTMVTDEIQPQLS